MASTIRNRVSGIFRSSRVRAVLFLYCGYEAYSFAKNRNTLYKIFSSKYHRPGETVMDLDLDSVQVVSRDARAFLKSAEEIKLQSLIQTLNHAQQDPRVAGLVVRGYSGLRSLGLAEISELRSAIQHFSSGWGGKHTMLHAPEGLGATGNGTVPLYFASAFDSIHVQPTSGVIIPGLSLATLFFKRMLESVGLKAKKVARKEFKTAANIFTEEKYTDAHRETTESLLTAIMNNIVDGISEGRKIPEEQVWNAIDTGIMSSAEARSFGIIDESLYRDELPKFMQQKLRQSRTRRSLAREEAEEEWRDAMENLKTLWDSDDGWHQVWDNGNIIHHLSSMPFAIPRPLLIGGDNANVITQTLDAEIRALKSHVSWLESCPWEAAGGDDDTAETVYSSIPHISLLMATEHELCVKAIEVLEELPKILEKCRDEDTDILKLDKESFLSVVRWCRSLWRAKSLLARIVGTLRDIEEQESLTLEKDNVVDGKVGSSILHPCLFLIGYADEFVPSTNRRQSSELQAQRRIKDDEESSQSLPVRHVRFSDYADTVSAEKRAAVERAGRRAIKASSGKVDHHERRALTQLQLPGHRIDPWKMNTFTNGIVAVVNIDGPISDDGADKTRAAIRRADNDPSVKAIVLRIESPGGSATASDVISRAVEVAKKPVVASMGSVCASGGYLIAAPCDRIFANAMTITGSIGVIFQTFNTAGLFDKIGITADSCDSGRFAKYFGPMAPITDWTEEFAAQVDKMIDNFYADFVTVVSRGRKMTMEKVENVARGRVWAGTDAARLGLVDEIGGLDEAIKAAKDLAHLAPDSEVNPVEYPTIAMQVQDAARRRGLIPSNLNEEGDEQVPPRRRRSGLWSKPRDPEESYRRENAHGMEQQVDLHLSDCMYGFLEGMVGSMILLIDGFLSSEIAPLSAKSALERVLQKLLQVAEHRQTKAIAEELEMGLITAGRPAATGPNIRVE